MHPIKEVRSAINTIGTYFVLGSLNVIFWLGDIHTKLSNLMEELSTLLVALVFMTIYGLAHLEEKWDRYRNKQVG